MQNDASSTALPCCCKAWEERCAKEPVKFDTSRSLFWGGTFLKENNLIVVPPLVLLLDRMVSDSGKSKEMVTEVSDVFCL